MATRKQNRPAARRVNPVGQVAVPKESKQQEMLFEWMTLVRVAVPPLTAQPDTRPVSWKPLSEIAFAVPNGLSIAGTEKQRAMYMAALKRQGFRPGVSDIVIPYPTLAYHGLFIELKRDAKAKVSDEQKDWRYKMDLLGYRAEICVGWEAARSVIEEYFSGTRITVSPPAPARLVI